MNNSENSANPSAPDQELLRELMPQLGMEATEPKHRYKNQLRLKILLPKALLLCALAAALFLLGSYAFTPAQVYDMQVTEGPTQAEATFQVDKLVLLESVTAQLDGMPMAVQRQSAGSYKIEVDRNGALSIAARTFTGRESKTEVTVSSIDEEPPHIDSHKLAGGQMTIRFADNGGSGIDWQTLHATEVGTGADFDIPEIDEQNDLIRFPFPSDSIRISLSDKNGNPLAVVLELVPAGGSGQAAEQDQTPAP